MGSLKGYKAFRIGAKAVDGGMGTVLEAIGTTVKGSVTATTSEGTMEDFNIEEKTGPYESNVTEEPQLSGVIEIYDVDPDTAIKVIPGSVSSTGAGATQRKVFTPNEPFVPMEVSGEIESKNNVILAVPRMQLMSRFELPFQDAALGKIIINWKALAPDKADTRTYSYSVPDPA